MGWSFFFFWGRAEKRTHLSSKRNFFLKTEHYGVNGCHDSKEIVIWDFVSMHHLIHKNAINDFKIKNYLE
jgi:hypothetical protein